MENNIEIIENKLAQKLSDFMDEILSFSDKSLSSKEMFKGKIFELAAKQSFQKSIENNKEIKELFDNWS